MCTRILCIRYSRYFRTDIQGTRGNLGTEYIVYCVGYVRLLFLESFLIYGWHEQHMHILLCSVHSYTHNGMLFSNNKKFNKRSVESMCLNIETGKTSQSNIHAIMAYMATGGVIEPGVYFILNGFAYANNTKGTKLILLLLQNVWIWIYSRNSFL